MMINTTKDKWESTFGGKIDVYKPSSAIKSSEKSLMTPIRDGRKIVNFTAQISLGLSSNYYSKKDRTRRADVLWFK